MKNFENLIREGKLVVFMPNHENSKYSCEALLPLTGAYIKDWEWIEVDGGDSCLLVPKNMNKLESEALKELIRTYEDCVASGEFDEIPYNEVAEIAVATKEAMIISPLHECLGEECYCKRLAMEVSKSYNVY